MKTTLLVFPIMAMLCTNLVALYAAGPSRVGGPKGGRLLENTEPKAEFYLEKDHTVTITFYDAALLAVPASGQSVTVIADTEGGKQTIEFENRDGVLVSKTSLPEGDGYNLVVQIRQSADAKPRNFRFALETHICETCSRQEYACICDE